MSEKQVRIGILGAARIAPEAIIAPAKKLSSVEVVAIAARDVRKAEAFAGKHGVPRVYQSYDELLAARDIDLIYNPLPISLHCEWTIKALEAGKHVLCEKPFAANQSEAVLMADAAIRNKRVLVEAFHYRYHPLFAGAKEALPKIGAIKQIEAYLSVPLIYFGALPGDIRYRADLAGGVTMDLGCYCIHLMRHLLAAEPTVVSAKAHIIKRQIDLTMKADLIFPGDVRATMMCSMYHYNPRHLFRMSTSVHGESGVLKITNPVLPQQFNKLSLATAAGKQVKRFKEESTYYFQLKAVANHILDNAPLPVDCADAIANMRVIDDIYMKAGMELRGK